MKPESKLSKVELIQNALLSGKTREEAAEEFGYKSWKSLDIYVRRHGLKWDARRNSYYNPAEGIQSAASASTNLAAKVISIFTRQECDPREAAKTAGFKDHHDMASYMAARGYVWSFEENNYIKSEKQIDLSYDADDFEQVDDENEFLHTAFSKYLPILDMLYKNKDKLYKFMASDAPSETIPRYMIPGINKTKSFYLSHELSQLVIEFSQRCNISQKEVLETALIEFLKAYSFEDEVKELLNR